MDFVIEKATVTQAKAKVALVGPAGSGKTMTALILARELGERTLNFGQGIGRKNARYRH
jgi:cytidylate kinase